MFSSIFNYFVTDNHHMSLLGIIVFLTIAFIFSNNKRKIKPKRILAGLAMQFALAVFVLKTEIGVRFFTALSDGFSQIYKFTDYFFLSGVSRL